MEDKLGAQLNPPNLQNAQPNHPSVREIINPLRSWQGFRDEAMQNLPEDVRKFVDDTSWAGELLNDERINQATQALEALVTEMVNEIIPKDRLCEKHHTHRKDWCSYCDDAWTENEYNDEIRQRAKAEIERRFL